MADNKPSQLIIALQIAKIALEKTTSVRLDAHKDVYKAISKAIYELEEIEHLNHNWRSGLYNVMPRLEYLFEEASTGKSQPQYFVLSTINNEIFRLSEYSSEAEAIAAAQSIPNDEWDFERGDVILVLRSDPANVDTHRCAEAILWREP